MTGAGSVFSTGREIPSDVGEIPRLQAATAVSELPVPVLAALNGDASDHGLELALAADLRLADPRSAVLVFAARSESVSV